MRKRGLSSGRPSTTPLVLFLLLLALGACLGLDYIRFAKGERSYIFARILPEKPAASPEEAFARDVVKALVGQGLDPGAVKMDRDGSGRLRLRIELRESLYETLEGFLINELAALNASVEVRKGQPVKKAVLRHWSVEGRERGRFDILFRCLPDEPAAKVEPKPAVQPPRARHRAALIIDDMGNSLQAADDLCRLGRALTVAVLPLTPQAEETAARARACGLEVILHLPLESVNGNTYEPGGNGEGFILAGMSEDEIRTTVDGLLAHVPGVAGVNSHMGSKVTADGDTMERVLAVLKERNLFFVDSRTSGRSLAYEQARRMDVPTAYRDVFLDPDGVESDVKAQFVEFLRVARRKDGAIAIGHPFPNTLGALKDLLPLLEIYNIELVPVSRIVRR